MEPGTMELLVDGWYDCLNDCYSNKMDISLILSYLQAITDFDY